MRIRHRVVDPRLVVVLAVAVALTLVLVVLALRQAEPDPTARPGVETQPRVGPDRGADRLRRYVALGDWWAGTVAASQGGASRAEETDEACRRSTGSYPRLVADRLGLELDHLACAGSSPAVVALGGTIAEGADLPPQLDALSASTDLVTVSVGAESADLLASTVSTCQEVADSDPSGSPCRDRFGDAGLDAVRADAQRMATATQALLTEVARRAPRARLLVVAYADFFATGASCLDRTGLADGDLAYLSEAMSAVVEAVRTAAAATGVELVDPQRPFAGHLVCSRTPYVVRDATGTGPGFALTAAGHAALADAVVRQLAGGRDAGQ